MTPAACGADDDPFPGAYGATEGPMSLVDRTDGYAVRADDESLHGRLRRMGVAHRGLVVR